jgi:hypothetical protein
MPIGIALGIPGTENGAHHGGVMKIDELGAAVGLGRVRVTDRADEELLAQRLTMDQVCASVAQGEVVEEIAEGRDPYPGCRVAGRVADGSRVESVWAWNARTGWVALVHAGRIPPPERAEPEGSS